MQVRFLSKDGNRFLKEMSEPLPQRHFEMSDPSKDADVLKLARVLFNRKLWSEAARRGEGNAFKATQIMWDKTKPEEREAAIVQAMGIESELGRSDGWTRTYRLFKSRAGHPVFIEVGCIFNDLTAEDFSGVVALSRGPQDMPRVNTVQPGSYLEKTAVEVRHDNFRNE